MRNITFKYDVKMSSGWLYVCIARILGFLRILPIGELFGNKLGFRLWENVKVPFKDG